MFYYYGGKRRLARYYPVPSRSLVIEPFAGAAGYSMYWALRRDDLRFLLIEKDRRVVDVWHRLLSLTPDTIAEYPVPAEGESTSDRFVMFAAASNAVAVSSQLRVTRRVRTEALRMRKSAAKLRAALGSRITVLHGCYLEASNLDATWFIDPPYQVQTRTSKTARPGGHGYGPECRNSDIDFAQLGGWVQSRRGQVIVCEQGGACWLPFRDLREHTNTVGRPTREVVWVHEDPRRAVGDE